MKKCQSANITLLILSCRVCKFATSRRNRVFCKNDFVYPAPLCNPQVLFLEYKKVYNPQVYVRKYGSVEPCLYVAVAVFVHSLALVLVLEQIFSVVLRFVSPHCLIV